MAGAAKDHGLQYLGIADHSKSSFQANGLHEDRLIEQIATIRKLNESSDEFALIAGSEVDILKDGSLDFNNEPTRLLRCLGPQCLQPSRR